jgi:PAS domain S-box-containing protein
MTIDGGKTILLVEDEAVIALAEARMLKKNGYTVYTAYSGSSALQTVSDGTTIDLVLMDLDLGAGMDGTEVAEKILDAQSLPVLFLSSHTEPEVVEKTERITSYGYVVKNSGETVLLASIKMAFKLFEARIQNQRKTAELEVANLRLGELVEGQKRVEVELREREAEFRSLFEAAPAGVAMLCDRIFKKVNLVMCETFGYSEGEMLGRTTRMLYVDDEEYARVGEELYGGLRLNRRVVQETKLRKKDGTVIDVMIGASALDPAASDPMSSVATVIVDLSARKKIESELSRSLEEKEILLHELQHRIKNNLAMIGSMVGLEKDRTEGDKTRSILEGLESRIRSISSLYDLLLSSGSTKAVDLPEYLNSIIGSLEEAYSGGNGKIEIERRMESVSTDVKSSVAWGLITNELTTNALKYAFPSGATGVISIDLSIGNGEIRLVVSDNGIGLPQGFDLNRSGGLGIDIVRMMASQLNGKLSREMGKGTTFVVSAPLPAAAIA